jgi:hypothetical protein
MAKSVLEVVVFGQRLSPNRRHDQTVHFPMIGLFVLAQIVGFTGVARADDIDVHVEASKRHFQCLGGVIGFVGLGVGLRAHGIHGDLPIDLTTPSAQAQLALEAKMRKVLKGVAITGAIVVTGVVTALVIIAVRARHGVDADLDLDCDTGWQLAPGPGLAGLGIARTF